MRASSLFRDRGGFSLIELMTTVAIVGILVAIALPSYRKMQAKAQQAETAGNLAAIFVAEAAYFVESQRYGSFTEIGFELRGVSNRYTYRSPAVGGVGGSTETVGVDLINSLGGVTRPENTVVPSGANLVAPGTPATFTATASGNIDTDATLDQWHVNNDKEDVTVPDVDDSSS